MKWILLGALLLVVLGVGTLAVKAMGRAWWTARYWTRRRGRTPARQAPRLRCLQCHGSGWVNREPERTFRFTGEGFEDVHSPATMCQSCGGTGIAAER